MTMATSLCSREHRKLTCVHASGGRGLRVLEEIRSGAVLKAEALPQDLNQWLAKADKHKVSQRVGGQPRG